MEKWKSHTNDLNLHMNRVQLQKKQFILLIYDIHEAHQNCSHFYIFEKNLKLLTNKTKKKKKSKRNKIVFKYLKCTQIPKIITNFLSYFQFTSSRISVVNVMHEIKCAYQFKWYSMIVENSTIDHTNNK